MTQEEFKQYSELQEKFNTDVNRVTNFLKEIDEDLNFVNEYQLIDTNQVKTHGWEYWPFQGSEEHYGYFDAEMLTWTDDELRKYVDNAKKGKEAIQMILKAEELLSDVYRHLNFGDTSDYFGRGYGSRSGAKATIGLSNPHKIWGDEGHDYTQDEF